jgi:hypothetical protein
LKIKLLEKNDADVPIYLAAVIILERLLKHDEHNRKGRRNFIQGLDE